VIIVLNQKLLYSSDIMETVNAILIITSVIALTGAQTATEQISDLLQDTDLDVALLFEKFKSEHGILLLCF